LIDDEAKKIEDEAQREVQRKQMLIDDEAKKIEDEAQREVQRKRNSKLMRQMQEVRGEQWLEERLRPLPDTYFPEVTFCVLRFFFFRLFN
jgi:hypothetical protein